MKMLSLIAVTTCFCISLFAASEKIERKSYEEECRQTSIISSREDEQLFLTPNLSSGMSDLAGKLVLDAGCKVGAWAKEFVDQGATVCCIDSSSECIDRVQVAIAVAGIEDQIKLFEGNLVALPYENDAFDAAISVYAGDELPRTVHKVVGNNMLVGGLELHMHEVARVLKEGATATVVAPASYDVVFTDGSRCDEVVFQQIQKALAQLGRYPDASKVEAKLGKLEEVNRATFIEKEGYLTLVTDTTELQPGERIWRKEFEKVEHCFYHTEEEYLVALANAGLHCSEIKRPCFFGNVKYQMYQDKKEHASALGTGYIDYNPFTIYTVVKNTQS